MNDMRNALVTGGSGGIGSAICRKLSEMGYHTLVHYYSGSETANRLVDEIRNIQYVAGTDTRMVLKKWR